LKKLSSQDTDLDYCFHAREKGNLNQIHLLPEEQNRLMYLIHKLSSTEGFGKDLLEQAIFLELMVFLNKGYHKGKRQNIEEEAISYHAPVDEILSYINQNIASNLSIEALASQFYLSSSYLCRIFKSTTGTTINKYITAKRITMSKTLLSQGHTVNTVCEKCGFNDYSNYLKAFTKAVGISPKKYARFNA